MTTTCPEEIAEGKTSYELGWKVKVMIKNKNIGDQAHSEICVRPEEQTVVKNSTG